MADAPMCERIDERGRARERDVAEAHTQTVWESTRPSDRRRPVAAWSLAVPTSTGIRSGPLAIRAASSGWIASGHAASPTNPHCVRPTESFNRWASTPATIVPNAPTTIVP